MSLIGFKAQNHPQQHPCDGVDDRAIPPDIFAEWQKRWSFTVDVAASAANHKLPFYYSRGNCGLSKSWNGERVYCNPPFSNIRPWLEKAHQEKHRAELIVMLLPANRTEQGWWQDLIEPYRDRSWQVRSEFLRGRTRFLKPGRTVVGPNERPPFGCVLIIFNEKPD